jgi:hypothetical protein
MISFMKNIELFAELKVDIEALYDFNGQLKRERSLVFRHT